MREIPNPMMVPTDNAKRFFETMEVVAKGTKDGEPNIAVIYGNKGRGKTRALQMYAGQSGHEFDLGYVRAMRTWGVPMMLEHIITSALGQHHLKPRARSRDNLMFLIDHLKKEKKILIIDEVQLIIDRSDIMETLRDIHDMAFNTPIVLSGTEEIYAKAQRYESLWDRVRVVMRFQPISKQDVLQFAQIDCPGIITDETAQVIADKADTFRQARRMLLATMSSAKANGIDVVDPKTFKQLGIKGTVNEQEG